MFVPNTVMFWFLAINFIVTVPINYHYATPDGQIIIISLHGNPVVNYYRSYFRRSLTVALDLVASE